MMSMFSPFDLSYYSFYFAIPLFLMLPLMIQYYKKNNFNSFWNMMFLNLESFFYSLKMNKFNKNITLIFFGVMMLIMFLNVLAIFSYNFALTSQTSLVCSISFSIWFSFLIFTMIWNMKGFMSHCIPEGTPIYLTWLLFLIELVSNLIRPVTLTVRLVANILAGHLLMILLSKMAITYFLPKFAYALLNMVEIFVGLIQSYIFATMLVLYYSEI